MQEGPAVPLTFYNETVKRESWTNDTMFMSYQRQPSYRTSTQPDCEKHILYLLS